MASSASSFAQAPELFIDGVWRQASDGGTRDVLNPASEEIATRLPIATVDDLRDAAASSAAAFKRWKRTSPVERGTLLRKAATMLRAHDAEIAPHITRENGKTLAEAKAEVHWACDYIEWFAEEARRTYGRVIPAKTAGVRQMVVREPVGPVLGLSPWNWPLVTAARKIAPALAAGCTIILKPAEETPSGPAALVRALEACGLPKGVVNLVYGDPATISETLIAAPEIRKISFTGSVAVGKHLAGLAAKGVKPITMELGGHAPVLIFDDCDVEATVAKLLPVKFRTCGQVCSSPTRFFVQSGIKDRFVTAFAEAAAKLKVGDGAAAGTDVGPLISERRLTAMTHLVSDAVKRGGTVVIGGERVGDKGFFFAPTVLTDVHEDSLILEEEPFGPVVPFQTFTDYDDVIARANHLTLGLSAYAFTGSLKTSQRVAEDLECGMVGINTLAVSMAEAPFGGIKESGYGKEGGIEGIDAYLTSKFIAEAME